MAYSSNDEYKDIIYSGNAKYKIHLIFNGVELEDADNYLEKMTTSMRSIPNNPKGFYLDNLISTEVTLILHNLPNNFEIKDDVVISFDLILGESNDNLLTENNEIIFTENNHPLSSGYGNLQIPFGVFKIQDSPITDKNKITIKLRDNSVKLDFGYDAKDLMDENEGKATYLQILDDICNKANLTYIGSREFLGYDLETGWIDNKIKGRIYTSYIAEQAGCLPIINRLGELNFVPLNTLTTYRIPLSVIEKYEIGDLFKITRVCYESGIIKFEDKFETDSSNTNDTLYLDGSNPYINNQQQINNIIDIVNNFNFYSLKTGKVIGNPLIDSYDIIEIYDDTIEGNPTIAKTLATNTLTYNGIFIQTFDTTITKESKQENVTKNSEQTNRKIAKTEIDNVNGRIDLVVEEQKGNAANIEKLNLSIEGLSNTFSNVGGSNLIKDSLGAFKDGSWTNIESITSDYTRKRATGQTAILLKDTTENKITQKISCKNGTYTISFKYLKQLELSDVKFKINEIEYDLDVYNILTEFKQKLSVITGEVNIEFISDTDDSCIIIDLMMNEGVEKLSWSLNDNETLTDTVKIGKGIEVSSDTTNTKAKIDSDGFRVVSETTGENSLSATDRGTETNELISRGTSNINGALVIKVDEQIWITGV